MKGMFKIGSQPLFAALAIVAMLMPLQAIQAQPPGYKQVDSGTGVTVYRKGAEQTFVTVVNLTKARVISLSGAVTGAPNGSVGKKQMVDFWQAAGRLNTNSSKAFAVVNGTFFDLRKDPTPIPFGLKLGGKVASYGSQLTKSTRLLALNSASSTASIQVYSKSTFDSAVPDVIGGLDVATPEFANNPAPRTILGLDGRTLLIYTTQMTVLPSLAVSDLKAWNASSQIMLDGGGSTGLIVNGSPKLATGRLIPHAVAVFAGK